MCDESAICEFFTEKSMHYDGFNETLLRHMDWLEAAELIVRGMEGANLLKCSGFGDAIIENM